jgi:SNF2-related domain
MTDLLEVQKAAISKAAGKPKFAFFMEPGLGKTLTSLYEFTELHKANKADLMIVVAPNSLLSTWRNEVAKHGFEYEVVIKPDSVKQVKPGMVVLYNYEALIAAAGDVVPAILERFVCYVTFDESVQIKNFQSSRWKKINSWRDKIAYTRILSGRPMVQSVMDLWSQLTLVGGNVPKSPFAFRNHYAVLGGWQGKVAVGTKNFDQLQMVVDTVSFKAKKKDWLDLPEKIYTTREYSLTSEQKKLYKEMFDNMIVELGGQNVSVQQRVHAVNKLQQIGSGFMIGEDRNNIPIMPFSQVPKVRVLDEILEETPGKVIVFAHYRASVDALHEKYGGAVVRSGMSTDEINDNAKMFNDTDCPIMVAQLALGKYGHTWLGNDKMPCHTSVYFENTYALDPRIQSEDRNHRYGQRNTVLYVDLVGTPVERRIIKILQNKDDISKAVMEITSG